MPNSASNLKKHKPIISVIPYINAKPLTYFLENKDNKDYDISYNYPSDCIEKLKTGKIDAGIVSSIAIAKIPDTNVVDGICIASHSSVESVLLFSRKEIEETKTIGLDPNSGTSNALIKILMEKWKNKKCNYKFYNTDIETALNSKDYDAVLAIGDRALLFGTQNPSLIKIDLALEWNHFTGLPFVFAMWLIKKDSSLSPEIFREAGEKGIQQIDTIIESIAFNGESNLTKYQIKKYLKENLHYRFGSKERKGLMLFLKYCAEMGLIPQNYSLNLI
ncbi:conserved hypothetical protein [Thermotomaculum hydrothermale]|uniref:Chorismate dehydratase n=1 Tax=Thermotomaculum hydrothermale TaxID=981385 RepID=A0A7R6PLC8_9BACT|nr:menaquinone biosynthesis protein [Thermotomaculum hydrothermale]BBB32227.1 conserved hypothetical protein [Thermotomaculum hydrothermale]